MQVSADARTKKALFPALFYSSTYCLLREFYAFVFVCVYWQNSGAVKRVDSFNYFVSEQCIAALCGVDTIERECAICNEFCVVVDSVKGHTC